MQSGKCSHRRAQWTTGPAQVIPDVKAGACIAARIEYRVTQAGRPTNEGFSGCRARRHFSKSQLAARSAHSESAAGTHAPPSCALKAPCTARLFLRACQVRKLASPGAPDIPRQSTPVHSSATRASVHVHVPKAGKASWRIQTGGQGFHVANSRASRLEEKEGTAPVAVLSLSRGRENWANSAHLIATQAGSTPRFRALSLPLWRMLEAERASAALAGRKGPCTPSAAYRQHFNVDRW